MMRGLRFVLAVAAFVAAAPAARAGVYCSLDQLPYPVPTSYKAVVEDKLTDLRSLVNTQQKVVRRDEYLARAKQLEEKLKAGGLTLDEQLDLSGIYIRLGDKFGDARRVLTTADQSHFLVLAHLAMAYDGLGLPDQAVRCQEKALAAWPARWPNLSLRWSAEQLTWYRRAERYYLELLRQRREEARAKPRDAGNTLDPVFPGLSLEGPDGNYLVGGTRTKRVEPLPEEVPPDALQIAAQLIWWRPFDNRLYWLYGEMLNYHGDVAHAKAVLEELWDPNRTRQYSPRLLYRHLRELTPAAEVGPTQLGWAFFAGAPRDPFAGFAHQVGLAATADATRRMYSEEQPVTRDVKPAPSDGGGEKPARAAPPPPSGFQLPDWRTVAVSFAAGLFVMALIQFQWREWARRRERALATRRQLTS
jgi:hypothetical protein